MIRKTIGFVAVALVVSLLSSGFAQETALDWVRKEAQQCDAMTQFDFG